MYEHIKRTLTYINVHERNTRTGNVKHVRETYRKRNKHIRKHIKRMGNVTNVYTKRYERTKRTGSQSRIPAGSFAPPEDPVVCDLEVRVRPLVIEPSDFRPPEINGFIQGHRGKVFGCKPFHKQVHVTFIKIIKCFHSCKI